MTGKRVRAGRFAMWTAVGIATFAIGCGFQPDLFNPDLTSALGLSPERLPVNSTASVLISVQNNTGRLLRANVDFGIISPTTGKFVEATGYGTNNASPVPIVVQPNQSVSMWVACVSAQYVSVGSIVDQLANPPATQPVPAGLIFLGTDAISGVSTQPGSIEVPPINYVLEQGVGFGCGDNIIFTYNPVQAGYQAYVSVKPLANAP